MRITCPGCAANYDVPASRLKPGKLVRCARCGNDWLPAPDAGNVVAQQEPAAEQASTDVSHEADASPPEFVATDRLTPPAIAPPARQGLFVAWVLTFLVLAGAVAATIGWRDSIVRAWPPSSRILGAARHTPPPRPGPVTNGKTE